MAAPPSFPTDAAMPAPSAAAGDWAEELVRIFWASPFPALVVDGAQRLIAANQVFAALCGREPAQLQGLDAAALLQPVAPNEFRLLDGSGRERRLRAMQHALAAAGKPPLTLLALQDCSAELAAREQAERAQSEIAQWFELSPLALVLYDEHGLLLKSNGAFSALSLQAPATLHQAEPALQQLLAWDRPLGRVADALLAGTGMLRTQASLVDPLGRTRWLQGRLQPLQTAGTAARRFMAVLEDRSSEQERDLAHQQLDALMDTAGVGLATFQQDTGWLRPRPSSLEGGSLGGQRAGLAGLQGIGRDVVEPASLPEFERLQQALKKGERTEVRYAVRHPELGRRWLLTRVEPGRLASGKRTTSVVTLDVTAQQQAETRSEQLKAQQAELEAAERDRELMFSLSDVGIAIVRQGRITRANDALAALTGYRIHELAGLDHQQLFDNADEYRQQLALVQQAVAAEGLWRGERRVRRQDGTALWMQISVRPMRPGAPQEGFIATYVNVDDRRRAQQSLLLQTERERTVLDSVLIGIVTVGRGGIEWMNRSARRMFGGDLAQFLGQDMSTVATPEPEHPFRRRYLDEFDEGQTDSFECRLQARDGREFWVVGNAVVTGTPHSGRQLTYALLDIERRRQAEALTQRAQASLSRIIEAAPLAISLHDAQTLAIVQINQAALALAGRSEQQLLGAGPEQLFGAEQAEPIRRDMREALLSGAPMQREYRLGAGERQRIWDARFLQLAGSAEGGGADGAPEQLLVVASDVTEQRAAEEARLQAAIAQRELLVREVHHRIKNNLQGVAGLLQQIAARRPEVAGVINEAVGQVNAIAQVYGLQVGSSGPLGLRRVVEAIVGSVQRSSGQGIAVQIEGETAERWMLPEAESIPIALSLNELLSNAVKHGPDDAVSCRLSCGSSSVAIEISNTGQLPEGFNVALLPGGVLGLGLVRALLPRRSAVLSIEQDGPRVVSRVELLRPSVKLLDSP
ncbi:PAS domain S-box protein [Roseateles violae]|uniref:PAS domain S-box protein n=1 Tax=Roseateles violae TaxID=3058042 RepID=A0ABT8DSA9_9BURK|nr:PAS domain S-box protein [Pelomonas sp. PFR6]MDN3919804.1 PAS domain S-box protein [Pelomonas sp. PFR6]